MTDDDSSKVNCTCDMQVLSDVDIDDEMLSGNFFKVDFVCPAI